MPLQIRESHPARRLYMIEVLKAYQNMSQACIVVPVEIQAANKCSGHSRYHRTRADVITSDLHCTAMQTASRLPAISIAFNNAAITLPNTIKHLLQQCVAAVGASCGDEHRCPRRWGGVGGLPPPLRTTAKCKEKGPTRPLAAADVPEYHYLRSIGALYKSGGVIQRPGHARFVASWHQFDGVRSSRLSWRSASDFSR